ncbi:MAG: hypothetical protein V2I27_09365 [Erythrobacter sp.]|jgi:hypothetical protein|nr:hypothetical protein [Erythrobacter sp.]
MSKVVRSVLSVGAIIAGIALAPVSGGTSLLATKLGLSALGSGFIAAALTVGGSLIAPGARAPRNSPSNVDRLRANIDPLTPRKTMIGISAMGVDIR